MLKFKNAQTLSRTEMKKLMGGHDENAARYICANWCVNNSDCDTGSCRIYHCGSQPKDTGFKCQ